ETGSTQAESGIRRPWPVTAVYAEKVEQQTVGRYFAAPLEAPFDKLHLVERVASAGVFKLDPPLPHRIAGCEVPTGDDAPQQIRFKLESEVPLIVRAFGVHQRVSPNESPHIGSRVLCHDRPAEHERQTEGDYYLAGSFHVIP